MKHLEYVYEQGFAWLLASGPKILLGIIILTVGFWLIHIISRMFKGGMHKKQLNPSLSTFLSGLAVILLRILVVVLVMEVVGVHLTVFSAVVGSIGVTFGLALSGTLQNFASGVLILLLKPFEVGDNIIAQGIEGTVSSIQIFFTTMTTYDNKTVIFPNSKLSNEVITNITRIGKRRLDVQLKLNYGMEISKVKDLLQRAVEASKDILEDPKYRIGIASLEADGYSIIVEVWVDAHGFDDVRMDFQEKLIEALSQGGIKLPGMAV